MTTNWKRTETANGAGADALTASAWGRTVTGRRLVRALRWKQDAVCREASAAADSVQRETDALSGFSSGSADSTGSSITRTIFFSSRIQTQPTTRKETPNTTQEKKGKQTHKQVTTRKKLETLA